MRKHVGTSAIAAVGSALIGCLLAPGTAVAAAAPVGNPSVGCTTTDERSLIRADPADTANYSQCSDFGHTGTWTVVQGRCPTGLAFDISQLNCNWKDVASDNGQTAVVAGAADLDLLDLEVTGLSATVTTITGDRPLWGWTVSFTDTTGDVLCTAVTDKNGTATCNADVNLLQAVELLLAGEYEARFAGGGFNVGGSSAKGDLA